MGEDHSSFGHLAHKDAKERRDLVAKTFSPNTMEGVGQKIVWEKASLFEVPTLVALTNGSLMLSAKP